MIYCYYNKVTGKVIHTYESAQDWQLADPEVGLILIEHEFDYELLPYIRIINEQITIDPTYYRYLKVKELNKILSEISLATIDDKTVASLNDVYKLMASEHGWNPDDTEFVLDLSHGTYIAPSMDKGFAIINLLCRKHNEVLLFKYKYTKLIDAAQSREEWESIVFNNIPNVDLKEEVANILA